MAYNIELKQKFTKKRILACQPELLCNTIIIYANTVKYLVINLDAKLK